MKKRILLLLLPVLCSFFLISLPMAVKQSAIPVEIVTPNAITYQKTLSYTGEVQPSYIREVYLETAVIADEVLVEPGDWVQKGSVLARIDTSLTKMVLSQGTSVSERTAESEAQKALYEQYGKTYQLTEEEIAQAFGGRALSPETDAGFIPSQIISPMEGIVTQVSLSSGVLCSPGKAAVVISSVENSVVTISVKQSDVGSIRPGTAAVIQGEGLGEKIYQAQVRKIYPAAQKEYNGLSRETVVQTELTVLDSDLDLKSGYAVQVLLMPDGPREYFTLPYETICQDETNKEYIWVVQNGRAARRDVVTGEELPNAVEICSGISLDDRVILSPKGIVEKRLVVVR